MDVIFVCGYNLPFANLIAKAQPNVQYHHFCRTFFKKDCITFLTNKSQKLVLVRANSFRFLSL